MCANVQNVFNMNKQKKQVEMMPSRYLFIPPPPTGYVEDLMKEFRVSHNTVRFALRLQSFTKQAEKIRYEYYKRYVKPYLQKED